MTDRHQIAHAALAGVYSTLASVLALEAAFGHALCALAASLIYAIMARDPGRHPPSGPT